MSHINNGKVNRAVFLNHCIVLYEDWQMQCCGVPFKTGDAVRWLVLKSDLNNIPVDVGTINYYYEAHSSDYKHLLMLTGVVDEIRALHYKYEKSPNNPKIMIPVSGLTVKVDSADGWNEPFEELLFSAYIVSLKDVNVRAVEKSEVTFK